jgi:hypothetical protein
MFLAFGFVDINLFFTFGPPWTHLLVVGAGHAARADTSSMCVAARVAANESYISTRRNLHSTTPYSILVGSPSFLIIVSPSVVFGFVFPRVTYIRLSICSISAKSFFGQPNRLIIFRKSIRAIRVFRILRVLRVLGVFRIFRVIKVIRVFRVCRL